jgi:hypothetical protein
VLVLVIVGVEMRPTSVVEDSAAGGQRVRESVPLEQRRRRYKGVGGSALLLARLEGFRG